TKLHGRGQIRPAGTPSELPHRNSKAAGDFADSHAVAALESQTVQFPLLWLGAAATECSPIAARVRARQLIAHHSRRGLLPRTLCKLWHPQGRLKQPRR